MYALSVKQPYAEQIASGKKRREFRTWMTKHRGDLLIVASKSPIVGALPSGVAICVVRLDRIMGGDGDYEWHLSNPRRLCAFAVRGFAALYKVPEEIVR